MTDLDHIREPYRAKVAADLVAHLDALGQWDMAKFNRLNDYQRHLYALFLRLAGKGCAEVWAAVYVCCDDIPTNGRQRYVDDVLHSEIVGFTQADGTVLLLPNQKVEV